MYFEIKRKSIPTKKERYKQIFPHKEKYKYEENDI
jgi:hypothetical protein